MLFEVAAKNIRFHDPASRLKLLPTVVATRPHQRPRWFRRKRMPFRFRRSKKRPATVFLPIPEPGAGAFRFRPHICHREILRRDGQVESPFAGHGARGETFTAALHSGDQDSFWRSKAESLALRRPCAFAFRDPFAQTPEAGNIPKGRIALHVFEYTFRAQGLALPFDDIVE